MEIIFKAVGVFAMTLLCGAIGCMFIYGTVIIPEIPQHARGVALIISGIVAFASAMFNYLNGV